MLPELWIKIIEKLDCASILTLKLSTSFYNELIMENDLYLKQKFKGFPRIEGHCAAYDFSKYEEFVDADEILMSGEDEMVAEFLGKAKIKLEELQLDIVRGDLICFEGIECYRNNGVCIFDGHNIINLNTDYDDYGCLPQKFTVINNNVPIHYWEHEEEKRGIAHNSIIWFDQTEVKDQCLNNIVFGNTSPYTTFKYANKDYIMEYMPTSDDLDEDYENIDKNELTAKLREQLIKNNILLLDFSSSLAEYEIEHQPADNVVYISSTYDPDYTVCDSNIHYYDQ